MTTYIPGAEHITPAWLTAVLRQSGILGTGEVVDVAMRKTGAFNSQTSHLALHYSDDAPDELPAQLVLKRNIESEWGVEGGADEVHFYNVIAALPDHPAVIIPCYAAAYDETSSNSYLLLQDMSATHAPPVTRDQQISIVEAVPLDAYIEAVIDTLAQFHAYWWEHPLLDTNTFDIGYWSRNADRFEQYLQRRTTSWKNLISNEGAWFPDDMLRLYENVLAHLPNYWQRYLEPRFRTKRGLTLTHGDAYFANFLCPKNPGTGATYLLDWQSPGFDIGGYDLVNLCATFWTPEQRHQEQREEKILRRYYNVLKARGVNNYSWVDLVTDYKHGLIFWLLMPVQDRYGGSVKDYWWPKMQCLVAAFRDWHCEELLGFTMSGGWGAQ